MAAPDFTLEILMTEADSEFGDASDWKAYPHAVPPGLEGDEAALAACLAECVRLGEAHAPRAWRVLDAAGKEAASG